MTLKAFLFLFVVTIAAVVASAFIAERLVEPGMARGAVIAVLAGLVVFPAARWAEYRGWIKGTWSPGGELRKAQEARKQRQARDAHEASDVPHGQSQQEGRGGQDAGTAEARAAGKDPTDPRAGDHPSPGDPR